MNKRIYSRQKSFLICVLVYLVAFTGAAGFVFYFEDKLDIFWLIFYADLIATVLVYILSVIFNNSSLYDPYWSVVPPLIAYCWMTIGKESLAATLMFALILAWSVRLTYNWCRGWQGLSHEDWRYKMLRERNPRSYQLINFTGIHLFPTIMVFLGMIPVYFVMNQGGGLITSLPLLIIGTLISFTGIIIEMAADEQMRKFKSIATKGEIINNGLWKYSRHPNYFGEICFWLGLWVIQISVVPQFWWTGIGFLSILLMFILASIPMMEEKNLKSRIGYKEHIQRVSILIPWFYKKQTKFSEGT